MADINQSPDEPAFDLNKFEAEAMARATDFTNCILRLATIPYEDSLEWIQERGAYYKSPAGLEIAVKHELWFDDADKVVAKARITPPLIEAQGADGQLRRVYLARFLVYRSFSELDELDQDGALDSLEAELPSAPESSMQAEKDLWNTLQQYWSAQRKKPNYRPSELIHALTKSRVECKLPNSPHFRSERFANSMRDETKGAHLRARIQAGEGPQSPEYSIDEHGRTIAQLNAVRDMNLEALPLQDIYFEDEWIEPPMPPRPWKPDRH